MAEFFIPQSTKDELRELRSTVASQRAELEELRASAGPVARREPLCAAVVSAVRAAVHRVYLWRSARHQRAIDRTFQQHVRAIERAKQEYDHTFNRVTSK